MALSKHLLFHLDSSFPLNLYFKKWMFGLPRFPLIFLFMKSKGAVRKSMSDHIKQRFHKFFLPKRSPSPGKRQNRILSFYQSGRTSTHIENILPVWSRGSVAHCFNLLHNVRYRTTK